MASSAAIQSISSSHQSLAESLSMAYPPQRARRATVSAQDFIAWSRREATTVVARCSIGAAPRPADDIARIPDGAMSGSAKLAIIVGGSAFLWALIATPLVLLLN